MRSTQAFAVVLLSLVASACSPGAAEKPTQAALDGDLMEVTIPRLETISRISGLKC